ncbi:MAG: AAA family ATPase [Proteobacteria bacterium]|nr:AAA family ATPase [Pseudomonadota bacterium]
MPAQPGTHGEPFYGSLSDDPEDAFRELDERIRRTFVVTVEAVDPTDETNRSQRSLETLSDCVQLGFIDAARPMDGDKGREPDTLGRTLRALFESSRKGDEDGAAEAIEKAVADAERELNKTFREHMRGKILPALSPLGYPLLSDGELATRTTFDAVQLLKQHTKLYYEASAGVGAGRALPEGHNGLGLRNLIFILLQLHALHEARKAAPVPAPVCVLFLEEPEAHFHPHLEEIFIRKVTEVHDRLCGDTTWPLQIVVTTHSSHIANEVPFQQIRYFLRAESPCKVQYLAQVKDLGKFSSDAASKRWLTQYLTLTRCDLFFADKAVLIEGAAERLLLPAFLRKMDEKTDENSGHLTAQYLTTVEVDGRYAHKFFPLLEFIGVPALIITDLDAEAEKPAKNGKLKDDGSPQVAPGKKASFARARRLGTPVSGNGFRPTRWTR